MPKYTIQYDLRLHGLETTVELDRPPTDEEAAEILEGMSGADLCGAALGPPEVEISDVWEKKD